MNRLLSRKGYDELMKDGFSHNCLFCDPNKQIVLGTSEYWLWVANIAPYWKYHTLFVSKKHKEDIAELTHAEFSDFQHFYSEIKNHLLLLKLKQHDSKPLDQFILMFRIREEDIPDGSIYPKPKHLHIHFVPDRGGVDRFKIDETAKDIDIKSIALK